MLTYFIFLILVACCTSENVYQITNQTPETNYLLETLPSPYEFMIKFTILMNDTIAPDGTEFYLTSVPNGCGNDEIYNVQHNLTWGTGMFHYGVNAGVEVPFGGCHIYLNVGLLGNPPSAKMFITHLQDIVHPPPQGLYDIISYHPKTLFIINSTWTYNSPLIFLVNYEGMRLKKSMSFHLLATPNDCIDENDDVTKSTWYTDDDGTCIIDIIPAVASLQPLTGCTIVIALGGKGSNSAQLSRPTRLSNIIVDYNAAIHK